jgi:apolipoprotein N-acyltransferase
MRNLKSRLITVILILCSAALSVVIFPKFDLSFLAWFSLVPFLFALEGMKTPQSFLAGFFLGLLVGSAVGHSIYFMVVQEWRSSRLCRC